VMVNLQPTLTITYGISLIEEVTGSDIAAHHIWLFKLDKKLSKNDFNKILLSIYI